LSFIRLTGSVEMSYKVAGMGGLIFAVGVKLCLCLLRWVFVEFRVTVEICWVSTAHTWACVLCAWLCVWHGCFMGLGENLWCTALVSLGKICLYVVTSLLL